MPHIDIKYFPKNLTDNEKIALSDEICHVLKKHLGVSDNSLSVAMTEVSPERWKQDVYEPLIKPALVQLIKKPGYQLD